MTTPDQERSEYTIDELAAASQVPSRTIRFYQSKGALPRPQIRGRVAYYGPEHIERLRLIASLQDRGLRIDAIRELLTRIDRGELDVNEWLGLEAQLQTPWADDQPRTVSEEGLYELAGARRPGLVADLVRIRLVKRHGDTFLVQSPALLQLAMRLASAGVDLEAAVGAGEILRKHLGRAADELADYFFKMARDSFLPRGDGEDAAATLESLKRLAIEAVRIVFAHEMQRVLRKLIESGKAATLPLKRRKPR